MKYNTAIALDNMRFRDRAESLAAKGACVELTEITGRSLSQNSYLHLLLGIVAMETGVSLEYAKQVYLKRYAARGLFELTTNDKKLKTTIISYRSTAELTKEEMTEAIDKFKTWCADELHINLPNSQDKELLKQAEVELGRWQRQFEYNA